jgi:hypothetical protein
MTPFAKMTVRAVALLAAAACLFPPWNAYNAHGHLVGDAGYAFIASPPPGSRLDIMRLSVELAVLFVLAAALYFTTKDDAPGGVFSEETRLARGIRARLLEFTKKNRDLLAGVSCLALLMIGYGYYQNAEAVRKSEEAERSAREQAALVAQKQAIEEQHQQEEQTRLQAKIDEARRLLYQTRTWTAKALPQSGLAAHLDSAQLNPLWVSYKFSLTGLAAELETVPIYDSYFSVTLLDSNGAEIETFSISAHDLKTRKNSYGGLVALECAGQKPMNEGTYQSVTQWSVARLEK